MSLKKKKKSTNQCEMIKCKYKKSFYMSSQALRLGPKWKSADREQHKFLKMMIENSNSISGHVT